MAPVVVALKGSRKMVPWIGDGEGSRGGVRGRRDAPGYGSAAVGLSRIVWKERDGEAEAEGDGDRECALRRSESSRMVQGETWVEGGGMVMGFGLGGCVFGGGLTGEAKS